MLIFRNGILSWSPNVADYPLVDEDGDAVAADNSVVNQCECFITTLSEDKKGRYADGRFKNCELSITINQEDVDKDFKPTSIKLTQEHKGDLGEFQVQRIEFLDLVGSIEIWV